MLTIVVIVAAAVSVVLPNWLAIALLPALHVLQRLAYPEPIVLSLGSLDIRAVDLTMLAILAKCAFGAAWRREVIHPGAYAVIGIWLLVDLAATLFSSLRFGSGHMIACLIAWARLVSEVIIVPAFAMSLRDPRQVRQCVTILIATLGALVAIQFINFLGAGSGIVIGEVQGLERGSARYFGPVGDSVGFVLLLAYTFALCRANPAGIIAALGAILLTAGLGAVLGTAVATAAFLCVRSRIDMPAFWQPHRFWILPLLVFGVGFAAIRFGAPMAHTLVERFSDGGYEESGMQRKVTADLAVAMILDNPMTGVGFMGFKSALGSYGGDQFFDLDVNDGATANANNQVLQSLADAGIPGLICTAALVLWAARLFWRLAEKTEDRFVAAFFWAALVWLVAQAFGNLAATWLGPSSFVTLLLWIAIGLGLGHEQLLPETEADEELIEPQSALAQT